MWIRRVCSASEGLKRKSDRRTRRKRRSRRRRGNKEELERRRVEIGAAPLNALWPGTGRVETGGLSFLKHCAAGLARAGRVGWRGGVCWVDWYFLPFGVFLLGTQHLTRQDLGVGEVTLQVKLCCMMP